MTTAARDVMSEIAASIPEQLLPMIAEPTVGVKTDDATGSLNVDTRPFRQAMREGKKLRLDCRAVDGSLSHRIVWPVLSGYDDGRCLLIAWCETRSAFRHFRAERVLDIEVLDEGIGVRRATLRQHWQKWREAEFSCQQPEDNRDWQKVR